MLSAPRCIQANLRAAGDLKEQLGMPDVKYWNTYVKQEKNSWCKKPRAAKRQTMQAFLQG